MSIHEKLLKVTEKITAIPKDQVNPHFKNKYFDINTMIEYLLPILKEQNLLLTQPIDGGKVKSIIRDAENPDDLVSSELDLPDLQDPQKIGSCITYYRRYTLQSLLALQAEDDDGNHASGNDNGHQASPKKSGNNNDATEKQVKYIKYLLNNGAFAKEEKDKGFKELEKGLTFEGAKDWITKLQQTKEHRELEKQQAE